MAYELQKGMRRYTCLVPIVVTEGGRAVSYQHIHLLPVTRRIQRDWEDGLIQGRHGALEALIDQLVYEPYYVIEEMQHPDVELFNREFLTHLPPVMSSAIARGELPAPAPAFAYDESDDPEGAPSGGDVAPPRPPAPRPAPSGRTVPPPAYVGPETPNDGMPGANFELAQMGPDPSLGTPDQRARSAQAFSTRAAGGEEAGAFAREVTTEGPVTDNPLSRAVRRATEAPTGQQAWQASPRDPFDPTPAPEKRSVNRPPTGTPAPAPAARVSAEASEMDRALGIAPTPPAAAAPGAPVIDQRTGREAVFEPGSAYVPDMSAVGYEAPKPNGFGIGDMT